jgi:hypothetical protein
MTRIRHPLLAVLVACVAVSLGAPATAAPCANFVDVDDSDPNLAPFCGNVAWMRNRAVTTGCALAGSYCPQENVIRLSMAAFLNRLGNALTPRNLTANNSGSILNLDTPHELCTVSSALAPAEADFVRRAHGVAVIAAGCSTACPTALPDAGPAAPPAADAGDLDYAVQIIESADNGVTWSPVSPLSVVSVGASVIKTATVLLPPRDIVPMAPLRWAIRLSRFPGSATTTDIGSWACHMQVRVENRVTTSAPFDGE